MAENKLQNAAHENQKVLPARSYVDAPALQALIDKIGALRQSLLDNDKAALADALAAIEALKTELTESIDNLNDALQANADADEAQATEQAEIKAAAEKNAEDIEALQNDKLDAATFDDFKENDYDVFKTSVTEKLDEILSALQVVVSAADVEAAYDAATADKAEESEPAGE